MEGVEAVSDGRTLSTRSLGHLPNRRKKEQIMSPIPLNEPLLGNKLTQLEEACLWSSRVISKLETTIRTADDYALFRVNPLQYAKEKEMAEAERLDKTIRRNLKELGYDLI